MNAELLKKLQIKPVPIRLPSDGLKDKIYAKQYIRHQINNVSVLDMRKENNNDESEQLPSVNVDRNKIREKLKRNFKNRFVDVQNIVDMSSYAESKLTQYQTKVYRKNKELEKQDETRKQQHTDKRNIRISRARQIGKVIHFLNVKPLNRTIKIQISEETRRRTKPKNTIIKGTMESVPNFPDKPNSDTLMKASSFYLNNRKSFLNFINKTLIPFRDDSAGKDITCKDLEKNKSGEFNLLPHQKIVREYMSLYTPYRGLLLYHGLGSGKTCSSIAIAEGLKTDRKVRILTPASLQMNYNEELKQCGDILFKKNQHWNFIPIGETNEMTKQVSVRMGLSESYIAQQKGIWVMDSTKEANYSKLSIREKRVLDKQLNTMIRSKYIFTSYNGGIRYNTLNEMEKIAQAKYGTNNPFDNHVVIIDEAHNFISRIVNKIGRKLTTRNESTLSVRLYKHLMKAQNCKIIFLTGTPIINYPNEVAVLYNILRGYIVSWKISIKQMKDPGMSGKIDTAYFQKILRKISSVDFIHYTPSTGTLEITKNPFGFINNEQNPTLKEKNVSGNVSDDQFQDMILEELKANGFFMNEKGIQRIYNKALPDERDEFNKVFVNDNRNAEEPISNSLLFKRRIIGLTSYFRSAQEKLMPRFNPSTDITLFKIEMSNEQFAVYNKARSVEREQERKSKKTNRRNMRQGEGAGDGNGNVGSSGGSTEPSSTYRIFSRLFCNYVFPPDIPRPLPQDGMSLEAYIKKTDGKFDESDVDNIPAEEKVANVDNHHEVEDVSGLESIQKEVLDNDYEKRIEYAIDLLKKDSGKFFSKTALQRYSPKFLQILENLQDEKYNGLQLIYSQFRTLEGIGILKMVLEANGFAEFKLTKDSNGWKMVYDPEKDAGKPRFVLYTGTESEEEKEVIRNVFNGNMNFIPTSLREQLSAFGDNNMYGDFIRIFMITSSGAEGISLKNVNYVHIVEPYWHPVRMNQVIGRARRICSHQDLPETKRFVRVFMYQMKVTKEQIDSEDATEMIAFDLSKRNPKIIHTTDEALHEISTLKSEVNETILKYIKETSIDCTINIENNSNENLECFKFGSANPTELSYRPSYKEEENDEVFVQNQEIKIWKGEGVNIKTKDGNKVSYVVRVRDEDDPDLGPLYRGLTDEVYDYKTYNAAKAAAKNGVNVPLVQVGRLVLTERERNGKKSVHVELVEMEQ